MRSCYTTPCNFGEPVGVVPITWFFVDEYAKDLGMSTYFCSKNWLDKSLRESTVLGEVKGAERIWSRGEIPANLVLSGKPCGSARQWAGLDPAAAVPLFMGFPACCLTPGFQQLDLHAGVVVSGEVVAGTVLAAGVVVSGEVAAGTVLAAGVVVSGEVVVED